MENCQFYIKKFTKKQMSILVQKWITFWLFYWRALFSQFIIVRIFFPFEIHISKSSTSLFSYMLDEMFQLIVSKFATLTEDEIVLISIFLKHFLHKNLICKKHVSGPKWNWSCHNNWIYQLVSSKSNSFYERNKEKLCFEDGTFMNYQGT